MNSARSSMHLAALQSHFVHERLTQFSLVGTSFSFRQHILLLSCVISSLWHRGVNFQR
jgi:hypothetical protein